MTRDGILALISEDVRLRGLKREIEMKGRESGVADPSYDPSHDMAHSIRVANWTIQLGQGRLDPASVIAAALLHDIVNVPKNSPDRARASELCAEAAAEMLLRHGFTPAETTEICDAIRDHSYSRGVKPAKNLGKCLQDADRLESLGSIGIMRAISTGVLMKTKFFDPNDPWAQRRSLDDQAFSIDHFFCKLFKLPELMNTSAGRLEADRRLEMMKGFLKELGEEIGDPLRPSSHRMPAASLARDLGHS